MSDAQNDQKKSVIELLRELGQYEKNANILSVKRTFPKKLRDAIENLDNPNIKDKEWLKKNALAEYFLYKESLMYQIVSRVYPRPYQQLITELDGLSEVLALKQEFNKDRRQFIKHKYDPETDTDDSRTIPVRKFWQGLSIGAKTGQTTSNLDTSSDGRDPIQSVDIAVNPLLELKQYYEQYKHQRSMAWLFPSALNRALSELETGRVGDPEKLNTAYAEYFKNRRLLYVLSFFYPIQEMLQRIDSSYTTQEYKSIISDNLSQSSVRSSLKDVSLHEPSSQDTSAAEEIADRMRLKYQLREIVPNYKIEAVDRIPSDLVRLLVTKIDETKKERPSLLAVSTTEVQNQRHQKSRIKQNQRFTQILTRILDNQDENLAEIFFHLLLAKDGGIILASDIYINFLSELSKEEASNIVEEVKEAESELSASKRTRSDRLKVMVDKLIPHHFSKKEEPKLNDKQIRIQAYPESKRIDESTLEQFRQSPRHLNEGANHSEASLTTEETGSNAESTSSEKVEGTAMPSMYQPKKRTSMIEGFIPFSFGLSEEQIERALQRTKMFGVHAGETKHLSQLAQQVFQLDENKRAVVYGILFNFPQLISEDVFQWLLAFTPKSGMEYEYVKVLTLIQKKGFLNERHLQEVLNSEDQFYLDMMQKIEISEQLLKKLPKITSMVHHLSADIRQDVNNMIHFLDKYQVLSLQTLQALRWQLVLSGSELAQNMKDSMVILQQIQTRQKLERDMVSEWLILPSEALRFYSQALPKMPHTQETLRDLKRIYQMYHTKPDILSIIVTRLPDILPLVLNGKIYSWIRLDAQAKRLLVNENLIQNAASLLKMNVDLIHYQEQLLQYSNLKNLVKAMQSLQKLGINVSACFDTIISSPDIDSFVAQAARVALTLKQTEVDMSKLDSAQLRNLVSMNSEDLRAFAATMPYFKRMGDSPLHLVSGEYSLNWVNLFLFFQIMEATQISEQSWADVLGYSDLGHQSTTVLENALRVMRDASPEKLKVLQESINFLLPTLSGHLIETTEEINRYVLQVKGYLKGYLNDKKAVEELLEQSALSENIKQNILQYGYDAQDKWVELHSGLIFLSKFDLIEGNRDQLDEMMGHLLQISTFDAFYKAKSHIDKNSEIKVCLGELLKEKFSVSAVHCFSVLLNLLSDPRNKEVESKLIGAMQELLSRTPTEQDEIVLSLNVMQQACNQALLTADNLVDVIHSAGKHVLFSDLNLPDLINGKKALSEEDFKKIISTDQSDRDSLNGIRTRFSEDGTLISRFNSMKKTVETTVGGALGTIITSGSDTATGAAQYVSQQTKGITKGIYNFGLLGGRKAKPVADDPSTQARPEKKN